MDEWRGRWEAHGLWVGVAGDEAAPFPAHAAALHDLVDRFPEVLKALDAFLAALPPDHIVPLQAGNGGFAVRNCGFQDGNTGYLYLSVMDLDHPTRAELGFSTGLPDGYVTFEVILESGRPVSLSAFPS